MVKQNSQKWRKTQRKTELKKVFSSLTKMMPLEPSLSHHSANSLQRTMHLSLKSTPRHSFLKVDTKYQSQNSKAIVSFTVDKSLIKNSSKVTVYHNVFNADDNKWELEEVEDLTVTLSKDKTSYELRFVTPTFSFITIAEEKETKQVTSTSTKHSVGRVQKREMSTSSALT